MRYEEFEDTKGLTRIRISKKNRQNNGQKKKYKRKNNDLQHIHIMTRTNYIDKMKWMSAQSAFNRSSSLRQKSVGRHLAPLGHNMLIPSQPLFSLTLYCCMLGGEATNTNFIVIGLSRPDPEPMICQKKKETQRSIKRRRLNTEQHLPLNLVGELWCPGRVRVHVPQVAPSCFCYTTQPSQTQIFSNCEPSHDTHIRQQLTKS